MNQTSFSTTSRVRLDPVGAGRIDRLILERAQWNRRVVTHEMGSTFRIADYGRTKVRWWPSPEEFQNSSDPRISSLLKVGPRAWRSRHHESPRHQYRSHCIASLIITVMLIVWVGGRHVDWWPGLRFPRRGGSRRHRSGQCVWGHTISVESVDVEIPSDIRTSQWWWWGVCDSVPLGWSPVVQTSSRCN